MPDQELEFTKLLKRLSVPLGLLVGVILFGTVGYRVLWRGFNDTWLDAIYMTFITITTVGYSEIYPLNSAGRILTIIVAMTGIASLFYTFTYPGGHPGRRLAHQPRPRL